MLRFFVTFIVLLAVLHQSLFRQLGFVDAVSSLERGNPYWGADIARIFLWVNAGAFLSSWPVALGLRRPVGEILG